MSLKEWCINKKPQQLEVSAFMLGDDNGTWLELFWDSITHLVQELSTVNRLITDLMG